MDVFTPKRLVAAAAAALGAAAIMPGAVNAHVESAPAAADGGLAVNFFKRHLDYQHADEAGHLPASKQNVERLSALALKNVVPEKIADVGVSPDGNYAFLSAWGGATCKYNGVHVVDIRDLRAPREVAFVPSKEGSYAGEGVQALSLSTASFKGDVLVTNSEICKDKAGFGGVNIYDVTKGSSPTPLAVGIGDTTANGEGKKGANQNHSVFAWQDQDADGTKAYLVSVDNEESEDIDIFDITNPKAPKFVRGYDLNTFAPQINQASPSNLKETFLHDMVVKEINGRQVMLASYWDSGYVTLDVEDPANAKVLRDTDFKATDPELDGTPSAGLPPEGNAHQAEFSKNNDFFIAADEDFAPYNLTTRNVTDGTALTASQGSGTTPLEEGQTLTGQAVYFGRGCSGDASAPAGGAGVQIAVVERGLCTFTEKVTSVAQKGGYEAVLIFNRTGSDACNQTLGMSVDGDLPTFGVAPRQEGLAIFGKEGSYDDAACLAGTAAPHGIALGAAGDTLTFSSKFDGWGYVHLFDAKSGKGKFQELDTYAVPEAHDPRFAKGFGDLSVHEVAFSQQQNALAYFAYYSAGFRVTKIVNGELVEKGHYIADGGSNIWGVEVFQRNGVEYVAASDRDHGLSIYRYTGG